MVSGNVHKHAHASTQPGGRIIIALPTAGHMNFRWGFPLNRSIKFSASVM